MDYEIVRFPVHIIKAEEETERGLKAKEEQLLRGNPLVNRIDGAPNFHVKRRYGTANSWEAQDVFSRLAVSGTFAQQSRIGLCSVLKWGLMQMGR